MKFMRLIVMFDLPVKTKQQVKEANRFRKFLMKDGYYMIQYSVYVRICNGHDAVKAHTMRIKEALPSKGAVRLLTVTEKQYADIEILLGKKKEQDKSQEYELISFF